MPKRFAKGYNAKAECQRCGFKIYYADLLNDGQVPGLRVCADCWEPWHPQLDPVPASDAIALNRPAIDLSKSINYKAPAPPLSFDIDGNLVQAGADFSYVTSLSTVQFTDTTPDPGAINGWFWVFGDGAVSSEQNPTHFYAATGSYTVSLVVVLFNGISIPSATKTLVVTAVTPPPVPIGNDYYWNMDETSGAFLTASSGTAITPFFGGWTYRTASLMADNSGFSAKSQLSFGMANTANLNIPFSAGFTFEMLVSPLALQDFSTRGSWNVAQLMSIIDVATTGGIDQSLMYLNFDHFNRTGNVGAANSMLSFVMPYPDPDVSIYGDLLTSTDVNIRSTEPVVLGKTYHIMWSIIPSLGICRLWSDGVLVGEKALQINWDQVGAGSNSLLDGTRTIKINLADALGLVNYDEIKIHLLEADQAFVDAQYAIASTPLPIPDTLAWGVNPDNAPAPNFANHFDRELNVANETFVQLIFDEFGGYKITNGPRTFYGEFSEWLTSTYRPTTYIDKINYEIKVTVVTSTSGEQTTGSLLQGGLSDGVFVPLTGGQTVIVGGPNPSVNQTITSITFNIEIREILNITNSITSAAINFQAGATA